MVQRPRSQGPWPITVAPSVSGKRPRPWSPGGAERQRRGNGRRSGEATRSLCHVPPKCPLLPRSLNWTRARTLAVDLAGAIATPRPRDSQMTRQPGAGPGVRLCPHRVCVRICRARALTGRQGPPRPYQLDDVGDAEPVGGLDVLASFHEALIALEPRGTGMRRARSGGTAPRLRTGSGGLAETPSGRKQAPQARASDNEAGVSQRPWAVQGEARMPRWTFRNPVQGRRGCF